MATDRPRARRRRILRRLGTVALVLAVLGFVEIGLTYFWEEPFSALAARSGQAEARRDVDRFNKAPIPGAVAARLPRLRPEQRLATLARELRRTAAEGEGIGRIEIPSIDVDETIVEGTGTGSLRRGPGHYPGTVLPGERGTVGIAGHRTTYGAPFRHIDGLGRGDRIVVVMPYGRFEYAVERTFEVTPDRVDVTRDVDAPRLVLSACTPLFSSARRLIVFARLADERAAPAVERALRETAGVHR